MINESSRKPAEQRIDTDARIDTGLRAKVWQSKTSSLDILRQEPSHYRSQQLLFLPKPKLVQYTRPHNQEGFQPERLVAAHHTSTDSFVPASGLWTGLKSAQSGAFSRNKVHLAPSWDTHFCDSGRSWTSKFHRSLTIISRS